ncbi:MAG: sigma-54 dependent transcriptional regulator [Anaeromyxobacteraceae bacterium]
MKKEQVIVVEGDPRDRATLHGALAAVGYDVADAESAQEALAMVPALQPSALVIDALLPGGAEDFFRQLRAARSDAGVVVLCPYDRMDAAVAAMRAGAETYVARPVHADLVAAAIEKVIERRSLRQEGARLRAAVRGRIAIVGAAPELRQVMDIVKRVAPTKATVLVAGETGVGKEHVAQAIHELSPRRDRPFVRVNCAALSDVLLESELFGHERGAFDDATDRRSGRLEQADGGTVYLHEVRRLAPSIQVKLLRLLQHGDFERLGGRDSIHVDVRVVAGTHVDLAEEVRAGRFRDDLYYRLNVVSVSLPPLRERKGDIPALVNHFIELHARALGKHVDGPTPGALSALFAYGWPGNVRELESAVQRAVENARGKEITADDLPPILIGMGPDEGTTSTLIPGASLFEIEREAILRTLDQVDGSTARAAELLGVSVRKIQYRLKEYRSGYSGRRRVGDHEAAHEAGDRRR